MVYKFFGLLICCFLLLSAVDFPFVIADVGNENGYVSGGSATSGDDSGIIFLLLYLFLNNPILFMIMAGCFGIYYLYLKSTGKADNLLDGLGSLNKSITGEVESPVYYRSTNNTVSISKKIQDFDNAFSSEEFLSWTEEVFIKIQQAWTKRDWSIIRPFESNSLFNQHNAQLQEYIDNGKINVIEKINVRYRELTDFFVDGDKDVIEVELHARFKDYVIDANTSKVIEGDSNRLWEMKYKLTFNRKHGVLSSVGTDKLSTTNCPNCGAPTEITSAGKCEYCDSVITTGEHDWVLSDISSFK